MPIYWKLIELMNELQPEMNWLHRKIETEEDIQDIHEDVLVFVLEKIKKMGI